MKRRVVITGIGAITPLGKTAAESWEALKQGQCGINEITLFDTQNHKVKIAGEVKNYNPEDYLDKSEIRKMDRFTQFATIAAAEAVKDSALDMEKEDRSRCGVIFSSGIGGLQTIENDHNRGLEKGFDRVSPYFIPMSITNMAAATIAIHHGFNGMCSCVVTACAASSNAIGDAFRQIRDNYADVVISGGSEASITPLAIGGFTSMKALTTSTDPLRASIPFDKERSGFVMGEGSGALILEEYEHAKARGAKIYAEIVGYGATCDAHHITAPAPGGTGAAEAMKQALKDAGVSPSEVGYINAHGTSTPLNDKSETAAIHTAFGEEAKNVMVSSTKSATGHLLGASGAVEAMFSVMALREGFVPATLGYKVPDEECDLDIVPLTGRKAEIKYAMSNSLGFGGHNASLLFKKWED